MSISRQTTYHLLHTLTESGTVTRTDQGRYVLGLRIGALREGFARQLAPGEELTSSVEELARVTGETAYVSGWWGGDLVVFAVTRGTNPVTASEVAQWHFGDAHARASGKLLLAFAPDAPRLRYLEAHPLTALTPRTKTDRGELMAELALIKERGYASDLEEFATGLGCLAVLMDRGKAGQFALSISAPQDRFSTGHDRYLAALREIAAN